MRKGSALVLGIVIALAVVMPASAGSLSFDPAGGSPAAVASVASAIDTFGLAFASRSGCIGSGSVIFGALAGRRGEYRTSEATVVINPDRDVETMASTVFHELAHHAMLSCRTYRDSGFTAAFYQAQGIPSDRGWFDDSAGWAGNPSEHFAETAVMLIQGSTDDRIPISAAAVDVVRRWLNGEDAAVEVSLVESDQPSVEETKSATSGNHRIVRDASPASTDPESSATESGSVADWSQIEAVESLENALSVIRRTRTALTIPI